MSWAVVLAVVLCGLLSLKWEVAHDSAIMLYCSRLVSVKQMVPYRDFFDMNQPLTYFLLAPPNLFGAFSNLLARVYDLSLLSLILFLSYLWLGKLMRPSAALIGLCMFALRYFSGTWAFALQREFLALLPLSGLMVLVVRGVHSERVNALLAGVLVALLFLIKPQFVLYALLYVVYLFSRIGDFKQRIFLSLFAGLGFSLALLPVYAWLCYTGAWPYYVEIFVSYLPLYGKIGGSGVVHQGVIQSYERFVGLCKLLLSPYMLLGVAGLLYSAFVVKERSITRKYLVVGVVLSIAIILVAGQFWAYHKLHFYYFTLLGGALLFTKAERDPGLPARRLQQGGRVLGTLSLLALMVLGVTRCVAESYGGGTFVAERREMANGVGDYLLDNMSPGDRVQPLDWTSGAVHAMLIADALPATRFIYSFHFFHHVRDPYIQKLRADFMGELQNQPPDFMVQALDPKYPAGYGCSAEFIELESLLEREYTVAQERDKFMVWRKKKK
ncbi:MAG: hypothetical protein PHO37_05300 [Kiritimatiellae bacterium]|nr:hypothetical protein [Kiritimatiellia bacterium]